MIVLTALQALRDSAQLKDGESVLVWGASGGVGHIAVQVARALGAGRVDGVCSAANLEMVRGQGADDAFDYTSASYVATSTASELTGGRRYDVIFDTVATASLRELKSVLTAQGRVVTVGSVDGDGLLGPIKSLVGRTVAAPFMRVSSRGALAKTDGKDLAIGAQWLADRTLTPVIERTYDLDNAADACAELERGHVAGKLIITMA